MSDIIGISIGSCTCSMARINNGQSEVIVNEDGDRLIPMCIAFTEDEILCGTAAKTLASRRPLSVFSHFFHLLGYKMKEASTHPIDPRLTEENGAIGFLVDEKFYSLEMMTCLMLKQLISSAVSYIGKPIGGAVLTVPRSFSLEQKIALEKSCELAELKVIQVIHEPASALLAYSSILPATAKVLVADFGSFSLDLCLYHLHDGLMESIEYETHPKVGGDALNKMLFGVFKDEFYRKTKFDVSESRKSSAKLMEACEKTKCMISNTLNAPCYVESLNDGIDFSSTMNRSKFEVICSKLFDEAYKALQGFAALGVTHVLLMGGSSRIPKYQEIVKNVFKENVEFVSQLEVDTVCAVGAAMQGNLLEKTGAQFESKGFYETTALAGSLVLNKDHGSSVVLSATPILPFKSIVEVLDSKSVQLGLMMDKFVPLTQVKALEQAATLSVEIVKGKGHLKCLQGETILWAVDFVVE